MLILGPGRGHPFLKIADPKGASGSAKDSNGSQGEGEDNSDSFQDASDASQPNSLPNSTSSCAPPTTAQVIPPAIITSATSANLLPTGQMLTVDYLENRHDETNSL